MTIVSSNRIIYLIVYLNYITEISYVKKALAFFGRKANIVSAHELSMIGITA